MSYSLDGKRWVTSSNCRNSGVSERKSWLSESSTLMRADAECRADREQDQEDEARERKAERDQADPLDPVGEGVEFSPAARRRRAVAAALMFACAVGRQTTSRSIFRPGAR